MNQDEFRILSLNEHSYIWQENYSLCIAGREVTAGRCKCFTSVFSLRLIQVMELLIWRKTILACIAIFMYQSKKV